MSMTNKFSNLSIEAVLAEHGFIDFVSESIITVSEPSNEATEAPSARR